MGLLSDALRWINPPEPSHCIAHRTLSYLCCDLTHPHPGLNHYDEINGVWWWPSEADDATGVDW